MSYDVYRYAVPLGHRGPLQDKPYEIYAQGFVSYEDADRCAQRHQEEDSQGIYVVVYSCPL